MHRYEDALEVTETGPLVNYILSIPRDDGYEDALEEFIASVDAQIARCGAFRITKAMGLFAARR